MILFSRGVQTVFQSPQDRGLGGFKQEDFGSWKPRFSWRLQAPLDVLGLKEHVVYAKRFAHNDRFRKLLDNDLSPPGTYLCIVTFPLILPPVIVPIFPVPFASEIMVRLLLVVKFPAVNKRVPVSS